MLTQDTLTMLKNHHQRYPEMGIGDMLKFLHQSVFGCEHFVSSLSDATERIQSEYNTLCTNAPQEIEPLDGNFSRVPLSILARGLSASTLARMFVASSEREQGSTEILQSKLDTLEQMVQLGALPFSPDELKRATNEWAQGGYAPMHHTDNFKLAYQPSYRVISNDFVPFLPIFAKIDSILSQKGKCLLAIDGGSASGKTTLSSLLNSIYGCTVFHMDDFFLQAHQRTPSRLNEVGGNVDYERFLSEVLKPAYEGTSPIMLRRFDCSNMTLSAFESITPTPLVVVEGAYSMHPSLTPYYDCKVYLDIDSTLQTERLQKRNPDLLTRFQAEWIPLENHYFQQTDIKNRADLTLKV